MIWLCTVHVAQAQAGSSYQVLSYLSVGNLDSDFHGAKLLDVWTAPQRPATSMQFLLVSLFHLLITTPRSFLAPYFFVYIPMTSRHAARPRVPLNRRPVRQTLADSFTFDILDVLSTAEDRTVLLDEFPPFSWSEFFSLDKIDQKVPPFPEDRYSSVFADRYGG